MKGVFLDADSVAPDDLNLDDLKGTLDGWTFYPSTLDDERSERIRDADVVVTNKIVIDAELMRSAGNLKLILVAATGANNIDLEAAEQAGIAVANVRGYSSATVAQHTFALILALSTNLLNYADEVKRGTWAQNHFFCLLHHPITELQGKNLVIVGYGEIGKSVARAAEGFGMNVLVAESYRDPGNGEAGKAEPLVRQPLAELLPIADIVTLHCPLTPNTHNLIDTEALNRMKSSALLINVSRGGLVNEQALLDALNSNVIAGAGVDVLTAEPPVKGNPLIDHSLPNLIVTPHCAWGSREARQRLVDEMVLNLNAFFNGESRNRLV